MTIIIPNTFADKTGVVQLEDLDENFTSVVSGVNTEVTNIQGQVDTIEQTVNNIEDPVAMGLVFGPDPVPPVEPGSVVQFVNNTFGTASSVSIPASYNTYTNIPGFSVSITPKYANSKMYIMVRWFGEYNTTNVNWQGMWGVKRDTTVIGIPSLLGGATSTGGSIGTTMSTLSYYAADNDSTPEIAMFDMIDSPGTTSTITYQVYHNNVTALTLYTNRCVNNLSGTNGYELGVSSITVMEIAQ